MGAASAGAAIQPGEAAEDSAGAAAGATGAWAACCQAGISTGAEVAALGMVAAGGGEGGLWAAEAECRRRRIIR